MEENYSSFFIPVIVWRAIDSLTDGVSVFMKENEQTNKQTKSHLSQSAGKERSSENAHYDVWPLKVISVKTVRYGEEGGTFVRILGLCMRPNRTL